MKRSSVSLFLLLLSVHVAGCATAPPNESRDPSAQLTQIQVEPYKWLRPLEDRKVREMIEMIESINDWVHPELTVPDSLTLQATDVFANAYYTHETKTLLLPYQLRFDHQTKHPKFTRGIWAHEYGHAIFSSNISQRIPRFTKKYAELWARSEKIAEKHYAILNRLNMREDVTETEIARIQSMFTRSETTVLDHMSRLEDLQSAHDELFADLIAVIQAQNSEVILDGLSMAYENRWDREGSEARAFDRARKPKGWRFEDAHSALSPTRSWIWKYCLDGPRIRILTQQQRRGDFLRRTLDAFAKSIESKIRSVEFETIDIATLNEKLIQSLDRALGPYCHN